MAYTLTKDSFYSILPPAKKPQGRKITQKYLNEKLAALSHYSQLMQKRVNFFLWIQQIDSKILAEKSVEREDFFDMGFLTVELVNIIFADLATTQETEYNFVVNLLASINDANLPPLKTPERNRSNDLLFTHVTPNQANNSSLRGRPPKTT
jgi:hypothetical protein